MHMRAHSPTATWVQRPYQEGGHIRAGFRDSDITLWSQRFVYAPAVRMGDGRTRGVTDEGARGRVPICGDNWKVIT